MNIPLNSLIPAMATHPADRRQLSGIKAFSYLFGGALVTAATLPLVDRVGWPAFVIGLAVLSVLLTTIAATRVRERVRPMREDRYSPRDLARIMLGNRAVAILFITVIALTAASGARSAGLAYYFTYVVGDRALIGVAAIATPSTSPNPPPQHPSESPPTPATSCTSTASNWPAAQYGTAPAPSTTTRATPPPPSAPAAT